MQSLLHPEGPSPALLIVKSWLGSAPPDDLRLGGYALQGRPSFAPAAPGIFFPSPAASPVLAKRPPSKLDGGIPTVNEGFAHL